MVSYKQNKFNICKMSLFQLDDLLEILQDINLQEESGNIHILPIEENCIRFMYIITEIFIWCNLPDYIHGRNGIGISVGVRKAFITHYNSLEEFRDKMRLTLECLGWDDALDHMSFVGDLDDFN
jgi:hypothetical protein